jgi:NIPSNAP protein
MRIVGTLLLIGLGFVASVSAEAQAPPSTAPNARVYEMRTYYAASGKLEALHARFRNHTIEIFKKHGMGVVAFWVPVDATTGAATGNTLVYILSYPSLEARKQAWDDFGKDPEWVAVKTESEKDGKLVDKVDSVFLAPTDYSPMK